MALKKDVVTYTGHTASYHRIRAIHIEAGEGRATVKVESYSDEGMRHTLLTVPRHGPIPRGMSPTMEVPAEPWAAKNHNVYFDQATMATVYAAIYAALKVQPEFSGAEDVLEEKQS